MSDNRPWEFRNISVDYFTTMLKKAFAQYEALLYFKAFSCLLISMVMVIAFHDLFSMFLLRPTKSTCRLMAWGGIKKIVFIRWMLLLPAIFFTVLFAGFFATLTTQTCDDGDQFCNIEFLNYKMIFVGIALGLFAMALFYAWKRRKQGSVEYLMIASLMDAKQDGRSKFLEECKKSPEFIKIVGNQPPLEVPTRNLGGVSAPPEPTPLPTLGEPLSAADYRKLKRNT